MFLYCATQNGLLWLVEWGRILCVRTTRNGLLWLVARGAAAPLEADGAQLVVAEEDGRLVDKDEAALEGVEETGGGLVCCCDARRRVFDDDE